MGITPSQTVGPFFAYGLTPHGVCEWKPGEVYDWKETIGSNLVTPETSGERIRIEGRVIDGDGKAINDAMIEIWQADGQGRYAHPADKNALPNTTFKGFGRSATDKDGQFNFDTIKPGAVAGPNGQMQAPHVLVTYFSRGQLTHLFTRIYFSDEAANATDPILAVVPSERRQTLIAAREKGGGHAVYRFDIKVQGDNETVFFAI